MEEVLMFGRWTAVFLILLAALTYISAQTTDTKPAAPGEAKPSVKSADDVELIEGKVTFVTDGDQFRVRTSDGKVFPIRIHGIDAPEQDQDYGVKSRKRLEDQILEKEVKVVVQRVDSEGRYVGTVFLNGQDVGLRLLENGSAWHYKRASGEQSSDVRARYAKAELKARENRSGLWSDPIPIPPWEYRDETEPSPGATDKKSAVVPLVTNTQPAAQGDQKPTAVEGRVYTLGPRGGCYYLNSSGSKVYVKDKSLCQKPQ
jgi:endonuclease YncB( thermonuclease family)